MLNLIQLKSSTVFVFSVGELLSSVVLLSSTKAIVNCHVVIHHVLFHNVYDVI